MEGHGNLKMHVEAQFRCNYLSMEKFSFKRSPMAQLDEVREVVRAVFYGNHKNKFYLFSVSVSEEIIL